MLLHFIERTWMVWWLLAMAAILRFAGTVIPPGKRNGSAEAEQQDTPSPLPAVDTSGSSVAVGVPHGTWISEHWAHPQPPDAPASTTDRAA